jgi:hypothetical protein
MNILLLSARRQFLNSKNGYIQRKKRPIVNNLKFPFMEIEFQTIDWNLIKTILHGGERKCILENY